MVFNGDANSMDLCTLSDDLLGGTDDTDFPLRQKALYANWALREIFKVIYKVFGGWTFIDHNVTDSDTVDQVATNLLDDGSQFYPFATVSWLSGVSYKDANGNYFSLKPITLEEIQDMGYAESEFMDTPGTPVYYRPVQDGVKIYPSSDTAVTNGLIAHVAAQDIESFTPSSTSTAPGYDSLAGHETVAVGMAWRKAKIDTLDVATGLAEDWYTGLASIKSHYKNKFRQLKPAIRKRAGGSFADNFVS